MDAASIGVAMNPVSKMWRNRAKSLNHRARMYDAKANHLFPADLRAIVKRDQSKCVYCGKTLDFFTSVSGQNEASFDHVIRLCDGGSNTYENIVCACRTCNQRNNKLSLDDPEVMALRRLRTYLARKDQRARSKPFYHFGIPLEGAQR